MSLDAIRKLVGMQCFICGHTLSLVPVCTDTRLGKYHSGCANLQHYGAQIGAMRRTLFKTGIAGRTICTKLLWPPGKWKPANVLPATGKNTRKFAANETQSRSIEHVWNCSNAEHSCVRSKMWAKTMQAISPPPTPQTPTPQTNYCLEKLHDYTLHGRFPCRQNKHA